MIELLAESEQRRLRECATQAADDGGGSVLAIYGSSKDTNHRPEHIGSCILLVVDGIRVLSTAAHIADEINRRATLFVAAPGAKSLVPIVGGPKVKATTAPQGNRLLDHSDCAFWQVPDAAVDALGDANFLSSSRLSHNRSPPEQRYYTALGYPVSRNKRGVNHAERSISVAPSMHTSNGVSEPALAKKLRSGDEHIFVRFERTAQDADGATVNSFHPKGFSGGALLDLGDFTSPSIYAGDTKDRALLAGMLVEYHKEYRALVAVKIGPIVNGIKVALGLR